MKAGSSPNSGRWVSGLGFIASHFNLLLRVLQKIHYGGLGLRVLQRIFFKRFRRGVDPSGAQYGLVRGGQYARFLEFFRSSMVVLEVYVL